MFEGAAVCARERGSGWRGIAAFPMCGAGQPAASMDPLRCTSIGNFARPTLCMTPPAPSKLSTPFRERGRQSSMACTMLAPSAHRAPGAIAGRPPSCVGKGTFLPRPSAPVTASVAGACLGAHRVHAVVQSARMSLRDASCQAGARSEAVVVPGGLPRDAVVGVLGGGQLGKMLGTDAARMGVKLKVLDPTPGCPASSVAEQVEGSFRDASAVRAFAAGVDVLTTEIEHVDVGTLEELERSGVDVQPSAATIRVIQDKLLQKRHFEGVGSEVPLAPFCQVRSLEDARRAGKTFGYPFMLKARRLAYDGRGNAVVAAPGGEEAAVAALGGAGETGEALYAEKWVPHAGELGVMVVRSRDGSVTSFPPTQTRQRDSVCLLTETPTRLGAALEARARGVAEKAVSCLEGAGVFGVELFVVPGASGSTSQIFLNEIAPRPHNSGHFTIEACEYSQFEAHLRALLGWPLPTPALRVGAAAMLNVLGRAEGAEGVRQAQETLARALATPGCVGHWYGKRGAARGRKLGHVTVTGVHAAQVAARMRCVDARAAAELWTFGDSGGSGRAEGRVEEAGDSAFVRQGLDLASVTAFAATAPRSASSPLVGIVMGSDSDLPTMRAAAIELEALGVPFELTLVSAHRTPERLAAYARSAEARGLRVIVAGAGGAAHLPGMLAAQTPLPVVGVPVVPAGAYLDGMDALLSIAQMPKGVPVATVAVGNAANGGLLAARILGASDPTLLRRVQDRADRSEDEVLGKAQRLEKVGWREY